MTAAPREFDARCERIAQFTAYVSGLFAPGLTIDDLVQEARLGIWRGIRSFDPAMLEEVLCLEVHDTARIVIAREALAELIEAMKALSPLERKCVRRCLLMGEPYAAVGDHKAVDNAIQRARRKLRAHEAAA